MIDLPAGRWWLAMVTFERRTDTQEVLKDGKLGAVGWVVAIAPDEDAACDILDAGLEYCGLKMVEIENLQEVFSDAEIEAVDSHLAANARNFEPGNFWTWGTIHAYRGDGEA